MQHPFHRKNRKPPKPGLPPGTPVFVGEPRSEEVTIEVIDYDTERVVEKPVKSVDELLPFKQSNTVTWINVNGVYDVSVVQKLCDAFGIHPLVQEDIVNTGQRPKTEDYGDYLYAVLHMMWYEETDSQILHEQISLLLRPDCVITFQERKGDVFGSVRDRIRSGKGRIRTMGTDYLFYSLLDAIVDHDFLVLEQLSDDIDRAETAVMDHPEPETIEAIHQLKTDLLFLRKSIWPLREAISMLEKGESRLLRKETRVFLRDLYDHTIQLIDTIETSRDVVSGLFDMYLSSVSNRMNEIMKVLTMIATIFIPLSFVAGVYGMNFKDMPELHLRYGYPGVLGVMLLIAVGMLLYFRRKRWL